MSDLVVAAYAAETGQHLLARPTDARFLRYERRFDESAYRERLRALGVRWLPRSEFPHALAQIFDAPLGLFVRGAAEPAVLDAPSVAVVGARSCSSYGTHVARTLGRELAAAGLVVVSGLARGIDGDAHRGALDAGGTTVAVLGCGIDRDYPAAHTDLARRVRAAGLVVSEYGPPETTRKPAFLHEWRFPARNRIVAGLAAATVVVEARERSGALITADLALEEGREVFAVPGEITSSLSVGTNRLIVLGATPLLEPADVLRTFGIDPAARAAPELGEDAARVLEALGEAPAALDDLVVATGLDAGAIAAALSALELGGFAAEGDGVYRRAAGS
jgi:DNA processing protein